VGDSVPIPANISTPTALLAKLYTVSHKSCNILTSSLLDDSLSPLDELLDELLDVLLDDPVELDELSELEELDLSLLLLSVLLLLSDELEPVLLLLSVLLLDEPVELELDLSELDDDDDTD